MAHSVEQDEQNKSKKIKALKIAGMVGLALVLVWTVYVIATNLNKNERLIMSAFVTVYVENEDPNPAAHELTDCSKVYEGERRDGKNYKYVIATIRQKDSGKEDNYLLIVDGKETGTLFTPQLLVYLDDVNKDKIDLEITERDESVNLGKIQKTIQRYWKFHDVI